MHSLPIRLRIVTFTGAGRASTDYSVGPAVTGLLALLDQRPDGCPWLLPPDEATRLRAWLADRPDETPPMSDLTSEAMDLLRAAQDSLARVRELHRPHDCADHIRPSTPVPCVNAGVCRGCHAEYPCPTIRAIDAEEDQ